MEVFKEERIPACLNEVTNFTNATLLKGKNQWGVVLAETVIHTSEGALLEVGNKRFQIDPQAAKSIHPTTRMLVLANHEGGLSTNPPSIRAIYVIQDDGTFRRNCLLSPH